MLLQTFTFPKKATTTATPKKPKKSKPPKSDLLKMEPRDIAEQLTLFEFSLYLKITPQECLAYAKTQTGCKVTNLIEFCNTYDKLCAWVKTTILTNEVLGKRAATVDFWVKVAEVCICAPILTDNSIHVYRRNAALSITSFP